MQNCGDKCYMEWNDNCIILRSLKTICETTLTLNTNYRVQGAQATLTSDNCNFGGVPKTTLNFCTFLEKLIDLIESCYSYSYGLLQWKYRLNSAKGRDGWGRVWESSLLRASSCLLPVESQMTPTFLATIRDTMYRVLSLRESQPILGIQRFFSGLSLIDLADHPTWLTSVASHLGDWADIVDPKFHPKSQC